MTDMGHFPSYIEAGTRLAKLIEPRLVKSVATVVFGVPKGGVSLAYIIAKYLHAPLDALVIRKLHVPKSPTTGFGALAPDGVVIVNNKIAHLWNLSEFEVALIAKKERELLNLYDSVYRHGRHPVFLTSKQVILVDDGIASGATMQAAINWAIKGDPKEIIVATRIANRSSVDEIQRLLPCQVLSLGPAPDDFRSSNICYDEYQQSTDDDVIWHLHANERELLKVKRVVLEA